MIKGSGIDIVEISRLKKAVRRWGNVFLKRIFTDRELKYAKANRYPFVHLAGRFAAKEAVYKAFGNKKNLNFKDIEICRNDYGRPYCLVKNKRSPVLVSISHTRSYAVASAIIQEKDRCP